MNGDANYTLSDEVRLKTKLQISTVFKGMRLDEIMRLEDGREQRTKIEPYSPLTFKDQRADILLFSCDRTTG